jgi:hypothetical protein
VRSNLDERIVLLASYFENLYQLVMDINERHTYKFSYMEKMNNIVRDLEFTLVWIDDLCHKRFVRLELKSVQWLINFMQLLNKNVFTAYTNVLENDEFYDLERKVMQCVCSNYMLCEDKTKNVLKTITKKCRHRYFISSCVLAVSMTLITAISLFW